MTASRGAVLVAAVNDASERYRSGAPAEPIVTDLIAAVREYLAVTDVDGVDEPIGYMPTSWPEVRQLQAEARGDFR